MNGWNVTEFPLGNMSRDLPEPVLGPDGQPYRYSTPGIDTNSVAPSVLLFSSVLGSGWKRFYQERYDEALRHNRNDAMAMRRDCILKGLLEERIRGTATLNFHLEVPNLKNPIERGIRDGLQRAVDLTWHGRSMLFWLMEALWYGRSAASLEVDWTEIELADPNFKPQQPSIFGGNGAMNGGVNGSANGNGMGSLMGGAPAVATVRTTKKMVKYIKKWRPVNGDKLNYSYDHKPAVLVWGATTDRDIPGAKFVYTTLNKALRIDEPFFRERFIIHSHEMTDSDFFDAEQADGLHGVGLRSYLYWWWWLKSEWLANVTDWVERAGLGVRVWYYQGGNDASRKEVVEAAKTNQRRTNLIVPRYGDGNGRNNDAFHFEDVATGGADLLLRLQQYVDGHIERYVLGQSALPGDKEKEDDVRAGARAKIIAMDAMRLADTLTEDLLKVNLKWCYPSYRNLPVKWVFDVEKPDTEKKLEAINKAFGMGVAFRADDVRGLTGLDAPQEGDDIVSDQQQRGLAAQGNPLEQKPSGTEPGEDVEGGFSMTPGTAPDTEGGDEGYGAIASKIEEARGMGSQNGQQRKTKKPQTAEEFVASVLGG